MIRALGLSVPFAVALAGAVPADDRHPQHNLVASSHGRDVVATLGSNCTPSNGAMRCEDRAYPLPTTERLRVHAGGRIRLRFRAAPEEIDAQLRNRRSRSVHELEARGNGKERTIRLPGPLPRGSDRLGVFVAYERGDADFEVDLKRHRH